MHNFDSDLDYGGNLVLYSKYVEASCYMFNINGAKLGILPAYCEDDISIYTTWSDFDYTGSYHDIIRKSNYGLNCYFGWAGDEDYKTMSVLRGYTVRLACGGYGGGTSTSDSVTRAIDFDFDSSQHALFRPTKDNDTYLGSGSYRWKEIWGIDGNFSSISTSSFTTNSILSSSKIGFSSTSISLYKKWSDGNNHDMIQATNSYCALGYNGVDTYLRGQTAYLKSASGETIKSDINLKKDFGEFNDKHDVFYDNLKPKLYKYIFGTSGRYHYGFITQEVEDALSKSELTTQEFGGVNIMKISERETEFCNGEITDLENNETNYLLDKGITEQHNLIYSEFIALNTWQIQKLKAKIKEQEQRITDLETKINSLLEG